MVNLLRLCALCQQRTPEVVAAEIGSGGASRLKAVLTEALNEYLRPLRERRAGLDDEQVERALRRGIGAARDLAGETLARVRAAMNMAL